MTRVAATIYTFQTEVATARYWSHFLIPHCVQLLLHGICYCVPSLACRASGVSCNSAGDMGYLVA